MTELSCDYVVVRYVANPLREEAKNIGVLLRVPEVRFAGARFVEDLAARVGPEADQTDIEVLKEYLADFESRMKTSQAGTHVLFPDETVFSDKYLENLWQKSSGKLQFTRPRGAVTSDPREELKRLFELFALPEMHRHPKGVPEERSLFSTVAAEFDRRNLSSRIGAHYPIAVRNRRLVFSFGYRRVRGSKHEVVVEAVDLSADTFGKRVRALAPTSVKLEIVKKHRRNLETFCLIRLPGKTLPVNGEFELEIETLRRHTDGLISFDNEGERERFLQSVESDVGGQ